MRLAILQNPLNNAAAIGVSGKNVNLTPESINDELDVLGWHTFDGFLNDMVAVLVLHTFENISL